MPPAASPPHQSFETVGVISLGVPNQYNPMHSVAGPTFPNSKTLVRVTASGTITAARSQYWASGGYGTPEPGDYGPSGFQGAHLGGIPTCFANVMVGSGSFYGGEIWYAPSCVDGGNPGSASGYAYFAGPTTVSRGTVPFSGQTDCSNSSAGYGPCNVYSGSQSVTLDKVLGEFDAVPSATTLNYGDTLTITASVSPGSMGGRNMPWVIDSVTWSPVFTQPFQLNPCGSGNFLPTTGDGPSRTCRGRMTRSGTFVLYAKVNHVSKTKSVTVTVNKPELTLNATPGLIPSPRPVTFKATLAGIGSATWYPAWSWLPGTGISAPCAWINNPCTRTISVTGKMVVSTTFDGYTLADTAEVKLSPCATGDSVLDNDSVRQALMQALKNSFVDSTFDKRREQGGWIYRMQDGSYRVVTVFSSNSGCSVAIPFIPPPLQGGAPVRKWHSHPSAVGDTVYDCGRAPPGQRSREVKIREDLGEGDSGATLLLDPPFGPGVRYGMIVINNQGNVYYIDPADNPLNDMIKRIPPGKLWRWDRGAGHACTWLA